MTQIYHPRQACPIEVLSGGGGSIYSLQYHFVIPACPESFIVFKRISDHLIPEEALFISPALAL